MSDDDPTRPVEVVTEEVTAEPDDDAAGDWQSRVWREFRRRPRRAMVPGVVLGVVLGLFSGLLMLRGAPIWSSQTVLFFDDPLGIALSGDPGQLTKLIALRSKYASLAATEAIAGPAATALHVPVGLVLSSSSVSLPFESLLFVVVGTSSSPGFARAVSAQVARDIQLYVVHEDVANAVPPPDRFQVSVVSPAGPAVASKPSRSKAALVGVGAFVGGLLAGMGLYLAEATARRRRRA
ncbi:MAG TPA: hypothetical protein VMV14_11600 [Acidimicrobiales bacterium]|nr:hypothetical protein [Acidimicrobiales bacterium]